MILCKIQIRIPIPEPAVARRLAGGTDKAVKAEHRRHIFFIVSIMSRHAQNVAPPFDHSENGSYTGVNTKTPSPGCVKPRIENQIDVTTPSEGEKALTGRST